MPLVNLPNTTYCVSVVAIDTANRKGKKSEEMCFEIKGTIYTLDSCQ